MQGASRRIPGSSVAFALLALALWLRLLVPAGWMPTEQGLGIRPCLTAAVTETAHRSGHHDHHRPAKPEQEKDGHRVCPFTALAMALDAPPAPPLLADAAVAPDPLPPHRSRKASVTLALVAPPPPSTGPPPPI